MEIAERLGVPVYPLPLNREPPVALEQMAAMMQRHLGLGPLASIRLGSVPGNRTNVALFVSPYKLSLSSFCRL